MVSWGRRAAVWLLLAGYLFSVTAATSFHDHGAGGGAHWASEDGCDGHRHAGCVAWHEDATDCGSRVAVGRSDQPIADSPDHACAVCQFLSQKVLPARPFGAACSEALHEAAVLRLPPPFVGTRILIHPSRAPPWLA